MLFKTSLPPCKLGAFHQTHRTYQLQTNTLYLALSTVSHLSPPWSEHTSFRIFHSGDKPQTTEQHVIDIHAGSPFTIVFALKKPNLHRFGEFAPHLSPSLAPNFVWLANGFLGTNISLSKACLNMILRFSFSKVGYVSSLKGNGSHYARGRASESSCASQPAVAKF